MLSIPCLVIHENQYFRKKCMPDVSEATLQGALDAVAAHANCVGVTLEDGVYSGRETLELFASPDGKNETSYVVQCSPPSAPLVENWWDASPPPSSPPPPSPAARPASATVPSAQPGQVRRLHHGRDHALHPGIAPAVHHVHTTGKITAKQG